MTETIINIKGNISIEVMTEVEYVIPKITEFLHNAYLSSGKRQVVFGKPFNGISELSGKLVSFLYESFSKESYMPSIYVHVDNKDAFDPADQIDISEGEVIPFRKSENPKFWHREMELYESFVINMSYEKFNIDTDQYEKVTISSIPNMKKFKADFYASYNKKHNILSLIRPEAPKVRKKATNWYTLENIKDVFKDITAKKADERFQAFCVDFFKLITGKNIFTKINTYHYGNYVGFKMYLKSSKELNESSNVFSVKKYTKSTLNGFIFSVRGTRKGRLPINTPEKWIGGFGKVKGKNYIWIFINKKKEVTDFRMEKICNEIYRSLV